MPFNNGRFGEKRDALVKSLFVQHYEASRPSPPPAQYFLVDDSEDFLIDDSDDHFVTGS